MSTQPPEFASVPAPEGDGPQPPRRIGALGRRFLAYLIDCLILGVIGHLVAWPFAESLAAMGPFARLIGFFIALLYFAIQESYIGNGASLGKRLLRLQVVHADGRRLTLEEALARSIVFSLPIFLNGLALPLTRTPLAVVTLLSVVSIGVGGITVYMILFNRHTRQGLHDLSVKSFVAEASPSGALALRPIWVPHWFIAGALLAVVMAAATMLGVIVPDTEPFSQLVLDVRMAEQIKGVQSASAMRVSSRGNSGGWKLTSLAITIDCLCKEEDEGNIADDAARALLQGDPHFPQYPRVTIVVVRGYDIGIASSTQAQRFSNTPAGWSDRLRGASPQPESH
jgi:uncharacterized RDD family membrane protein YckC